MSKRKEIQMNGLCRLIIYMLGHTPDEFGIVPDAEGFISCKDLLWALHEEPEWGYVRQGHLHEVFFLGKDRTLFEVDGNRVRTRDRHWDLDLDRPTLVLPKILFVAVRRKAHPPVMEKGLVGWGYKLIVLSQDPDMAVRIGRRRDQRPVLLEVMTSQAKDEGVSFYPFGRLFLAREIPARFISGPPVSRAEAKEPREEPRKEQDIRLDLDAGTFILGHDIHPSPARPAKGKKRKGWKEGARTLRKRMRDS